MSFTPLASLSLLLQTELDLMLSPDEEIHIPSPGGTDFCTQHRKSPSSMVFLVFFPMCSGRSATLSRRNPKCALGRPPQIYFFLCQVQVSGSFSSAPPFVYFSTSWGGISVPGYPHNLCYQWIPPIINNPSLGEWGHFFPT